MHSRKKILLFILLGFYINLLCSQVQPTLPPSPTASALGKYVDNPVSLYTGTPDISIPLYEIELKDFKLPISLSYNPQDIQVATVASNVGLGWSLNAGGVITRAVRDWHDDGRLDYDNRNEIFDHTLIGDLTAFQHPYTKWGYYHAKALSEPIVQGNGIRYFGTSTYNLDLFSIYNNRANVSPRDAILGQFGNHLPGTITGTTGGYDVSGNLQLSAANFRKMHADMEPDIFYFNFAGYSGKFVFDVEGNTPKIRTVPYQNLKIEEHIEDITGKLLGFTVIDDKGNTYYFEDIETTEVWGGVIYNRKTTYNSAWFLSRITTAMGENVYFNYEDEDIYDVKAPALVPNLVDRRNAENLNDATYLIRGIDDNVQLYRIYAKRLRSISAPNISIDLEANHNRQDSEDRSSAKALTSLAIDYRSPIGDTQRIKEYRMYYDYFESTEESPGISFLLGSAPLFKDEGKKRLRLNSVREFGRGNQSLPPYIFSYNYYDDNGTEAKVFPNKYSFNIDLWGYGNGADNVTYVPSFHIYPDKYLIGDLRLYSIYEKSNPSGRHYTTVGGNRRPNKNHMDIGVLNKITYPTGGSTEYYFEPHEFMLDREKEIGGGLRIAEIVKKDGQGSNITFRYKYTKSRTDTTSSGKIVSLPMYAMTARSFDYSELTEYEYKTEFETFSYSIAELGRTAGSNVGYTNVIEYISPTKDHYPNGYTEYKYSFPAEFADFHDREPEPWEPGYPNVEPCSVSENGICDGLYSNTYMHNFFLSGANRQIAEWEGLTSRVLTGPTAPNPNYDWNRGLLLSKRVYNSNYELLKEQSYKYKNYYPYNKSAPTKVYGIKLSECQPFTNILEDPGDVYGFRVSKYEINTDVAKVLSSITETDYNENGSLRMVSEYEHNGINHLNVTMTTKKTSNSSKELITKYKYPSDYFIHPLIFQNGGDVDEIINVPKSNNILNVPIETTYFIKKDGVESFDKGQLVKYGKENGLPIIKGIETSKGRSNFIGSYVNPFTGGFINSSLYEADANYTKYDSKGNVLEVENPKSGIVTSFVWGYNGQYPIARIKNFGSDQITTTVQNLINAAVTASNNDDSATNENTLRSALANLRNTSALQQAMVTTYTYDPLVGMTSETNPHGHTVYYVYDGFNRLKEIRDADGKLVKDYEYNYKEPTE